MIRQNHHAVIDLLCIQLTGNYCNNVLIDFFDGAHFICCAALMAHFIRRFHMNINKVITAVHQRLHSGSSFACSGTLSISTSCENVDAAWSLVRTLLLEDYQIKDHMYNFPTNKHAFDAYVEMAMEAEYTTDPETGEQVEVSQGGIGYDDIMIELYALKQADLDAFMAVYENCDSMVSFNEEIMAIITEHAKPYFDGLKTAEETSALIQDTVGLYMMEQG